MGPFDPQQPHGKNEGFHPVDIWGYTDIPSKNEGNIGFFRASRMFFAGFFFVKKWPLTCVQCLPVIDEDCITSSNLKDSYEPSSINGMSS